MTTRTTKRMMKSTYQDEPQNKNDAVRIDQMPLVVQGSLRSEDKYRGFRSLAAPGRLR